VSGMTWHDLLRLEIRQHEDGTFAVVSPEMPGLFLAGPNLGALLADIPEVVARLRELDGSEESESATHRAREG
jgi:hypothetical protein